MFDPTWDKGCSGCTGFVDALGDLSLLAKCDTTFVVVSRAPLAKLDACKAQKGWNLARRQLPPGSIVIVSGVQQALDILARVLLKPGDSVWMEDPGYFGAVSAFHNAGVKIVPVPIDEQGISVDAGKRRAPRAKGVYVTPAHQFRLGVTMPLERRLEVLSWALKSGAFVIEDDYDREYRLEGHPVSALHHLDKNESVILVGSFNKLLFSSLRVGYMVLPKRLIDTILAFRFGIDQNGVGLEQAILVSFSPIPMPLGSMDRIDDAGLRKIAR